jgi:hypothetical protein
MNTTSIDVQSHQEKTPTNTAKQREGNNLNNHDSQQGSAKVEEKSSAFFAQVVHEISARLAKEKLNTRESQLIWFFVRHLIGYRAKWRPFKIELMISFTGLSKQKIHPAILSLLEKKLIEKKRIKGLRYALYAFNEQTFGRILVGDVIMTQARIDSKVIDLETFKVLKSRTLKVREVDTFKNQRSATGAGSQKAKEISNIELKISLREISEFLLNQPRQTKRRWEAFVAKVLRSFPEDESLLWFAIEYVHKNGKDFFGNSIKRSVIGLFESCEWVILKAAVIAKIEQIKLEEEKDKRRIENEKMVQETRRTLKEKDQNMDFREETQNWDPSKIRSIANSISRKA